MLRDPEKRAGYDEPGSQWKTGQEFRPPPGWDAGFRSAAGGAAAGGGGQVVRGEDSTTATFSNPCSGARGPRAGGGPTRPAARGEDHHAKVVIDLEDAYPGGERSDLAARAGGRRSEGHVAMRERRSTSASRRASAKASGSGSPARAGPGLGDGPGRRPVSRDRLRGASACSPSKAATYTSTCRSRPGRPRSAARVHAPTPDGTVHLLMPPGWPAAASSASRAKGIPGKSPGDFYAVLTIALPKAESDAARAAYESLAKAFPNFQPRTSS